MSQFTVQTAVDPQGWDEFVLQAGRPPEFLQSWSWGEFQAATGRPIDRFAVFRNQECVAVVLTVSHTTKLGRSFLFSPRGPVITPKILENDSAELWSVIVAELARRRSANTMFLKIEPNIKPQSASLTPGTGVHPDTTILIDLTMTDEQLQAGMHQKARYNLHLAQRKGVTVRWSRDPRDVDLFVRMSAATAKRQNIGIHADTYYQKMVQVLGEAIEVAIAEQNGRPLASGLMVRFGPAMTYVHGASEYDQRELMAPYVLHWDTLLRARAHGCRVYDLFGIAPDGVDHHPWAGITRFKKGFGGTVKTYPGAYNLIYDRGWYLAYRLAKRLTGK